VPQPVEHLRAALVLAVGAAMFVLATPFLDQMGEDWLVSEAARAEMRREPLGGLSVAAADLNRAVRLPLVEWLAPLQRPLRIAQSWSLYGTGPNKVKRFEVWADGRLVYRSHDPSARWLASTLRYRRIRPIVAALCGKRSKSDEQLVRYIGKRAERELGAREIVALCTVSPWPGTQPREFVRFEAEAPRWYARTR
jgi:hypothetical protein